MGTQLFLKVSKLDLKTAITRLHHMPISFQNKSVWTKVLYTIIHLPTFPIGLCFAMPCWKQHLEFVTVQRWTMPIKICIKKTILGDSTLISYPESPVTTSYYISYTSCGISVVDTVVTIAEWQLFSGRYLSCTKYPACKTGYDLVFSLPSS